MALFNPQLADKGVHTFPKGISLKFNVIVRLEFKIAYYDVAVQHVSYYATGTTPSEKYLKKISEIVHVYSRSKMPIFGKCSDFGPFTQTFLVPQ